MDKYLENFLELVELDDLITVSIENMRNAVHEIEPIVEALEKNAQSLKEKRLEVTEKKRDQYDSSMEADEEDIPDLEYTEAAATVKGSGRRKMSSKDDFDSKEGFREF